MVVVDDFDLGDGFRDISHYERWLGLKTMKLISLDRLDDVKEIVGEPTDEYRAYLGNGHFLLGRLDKLMKMIDSASLPPNASNRFTSEQLDVFGQYTNEIMQKMLVEVRQVMPRLVQQFGLNLEGLTIASQESAQRKKEIDDLKSQLNGKQIEYDSIRRQNSYFLTKTKKEAMTKKATMTGLSCRGDDDDDDDDILQDRVDAIHDGTQKRIAEIREQVNAENAKCRKDVNEANERTRATETELRRLQEMIQLGKTPTYTGADLGADTVGRVPVSSLEDPRTRSRDASPRAPRDTRAWDSGGSVVSSPRDAVPAMDITAPERPKAAVRSTALPTATGIVPEAAPGAAQGAGAGGSMGTARATAPPDTGAQQPRAPAPGSHEPDRVMQVSSSAGVPHFPPSMGTAQKGVTRHIMPDPASDAVQGLVVAEKKVSTASVKGAAVEDEQRKVKRQPKASMGRKHATESSVEDAADSSGIPGGVGGGTSASSSAVGAPRKPPAARPGEVESGDDASQRPRSAGSSVTTQKRTSRLKMRVGMGAKGDTRDAREQLSGDGGSQRSSYMYEDSVLQDRRPSLDMMHGDGHSVADAFASDVFSSRLITLEKVIHVMLRNRTKNDEEVTRVHAVAKRDLETRWTHRRAGASDVLSKARHSDDCVVATGAVRSDELHHLRVLLGMPTLGTEENPIDKRIVVELGLLRRLEARFDAIVDSDCVWLEKTFRQPFEVDDEMADVISPLMEGEDDMPPELHRIRPSSAPFRQGVKSWKRKVFEEVLAVENRIQCAKEDKELAFKFEFMGFQEVSRVVRRVEDINLRRQLNHVLKDFNRRVPTTIDVVCRFCRRKCLSSKDIAHSCNPLRTAVIPTFPPPLFAGTKCADLPQPPDISSYAELPRAQTAPSGALRHPRNRSEGNLGAFP
eukprot:GEMP01016200.1.p1 GENE.GEMP01016200.1~~GEMP01016200.1.p1  ORF type:complete len:911 (-),score=243.23 GEMP01016200.1:78-2810(-)